MPSSWAAHTSGWNRVIAMMAVLSGSGDAEQRVQAAVDAGLIDLGVLVFAGETVDVLLRQLSCVGRAVPGAPLRRIGSWSDGVGGCGTKPRIRRDGRLDRSRDGSGVGRVDGSERRQEARGVQQGGGVASCGCGVAEHGE